VAPPPTSPPTPVSGLDWQHKRRLLLQLFISPKWRACIFRVFFIYTKKLHENKLAAKIGTFLEGRFKTVDHGRIIATCVVEQTI
jgi:hypothetical protein